jgi:hypothetical protein
LGIIAQNLILILRISSGLNACPRQGALAGTLAGDEDEFELRMSWKKT